MLKKILLVVFITCICNNINATDMGNSVGHNVTTQQHSSKKNSSNNNKVTIDNDKYKNNYCSNNGSTVDTKKIQSGIYNEKIGGEINEFKDDFVEQNIPVESDKTYDSWSEMDEYDSEYRQSYDNESIQSESDGEIEELEIALKNLNDTMASNQNRNDSTLFLKKDMTYSIDEENESLEEE